MAETSEDNMHNGDVKECYYRQRIDLAKGVLTEREKKKKGFLPEKELIKELQSWHKDLPLSIEVKEKILRTFPELSLLEYQRFHHVFQVIEYFHRLVSGNFNYFVNTLSVDEKEGAYNKTIDKYIGNLKKLHDIYDSLREDEKEILWLITILHDIGDIGEHSEHSETGSELIRSLLVHSDYSDDDVNLASSVVNYHIYPGMVAEGERTPRSLINGIESISQDGGVQNKFSEFLIIFHIVDLAGWKAGKNSLTPDKLETRMKYLYKINLKDLKENFWMYRLEKLSKEVFAKKIEGQINQLIPNEEMEFFTKHLNETVDVEDCMPIIKSLPIKNFVKIFRFFAQFAELYGTDRILISSNHYPLEKEYEFVLDSINKCLIRVPDKMSKDELRNHLETNGISSFYGIPIISIKKDKKHRCKLIFDIDTLIEQKGDVGVLNG